jgi:hypothetical protein
MSANSAELLSAYAYFVKNQKDNNVLAKVLQKRVKNNRLDEDRKELFLQTFQNNFDIQSKIVIERLKEIMKNHNSSEIKTFKNFFNPELLKDEKDTESFAKAFLILAQRIYPNSFEDSELKTGFMSLFLYDYIDPNSLGFYNPEVFGELFEEFFLNATTPDDNRAFRDKFFKKTNYLPLGDYDNQKIATLFEDNTFFKFHPELWYTYFSQNNNPELKTSGLEFRDSFGYFAVFPEIENEKHNILGLVANNTTYTFTNRVKNLCFVVPKIKSKDGSGQKEENMFDNKTIIFQDPSIHIPNFINLKKNQGINLYYNFPPSDIEKTLPKIDSKHTLPRPSNSFYLQNYLVLSGGMKKNRLKGGSFDDLFNQTKAPFLSFEREKTKFNKKIFLECLKELQKNPKDIFKEIIQKLYSTVLELTKHPVVYYDENTVIGNGTQNFGLSYKDIRVFFLFSYIYTTLIRLFIGFFSNIYIYYDHTVKIYERRISDENQKKRNGDPQLINFWTQFIRKTRKLLEYIKKIIGYLQLAVNLKNNEESITKENNFAGFNLYFFEKLEGNNNEEQRVNKFRPFMNMFIDFAYGLVSGSSNSTPKIIIKDGYFATFLRTFSTLFGEEIIFGGVQELLNQDKFLNSYIYFIEYLKLCLKKFTEEKKITNKEEKKLTIAEIEKIKKNGNSFSRSIEQFSKKDIKTLMSAIFEKVISMFVRKLIIINDSQKTPNSSKRTSAFSSHNSKNSKENIAQKQSLEYKAYIATVEGKLNDLLKYFDVSTSIPPFDLETTKLFIIGRFNNLMAILENIELNIESSSLAEILRKINISINFNDTEENIAKTLFDYFKIIFFNEYKFNEKFYDTVLGGKSFFLTNPKFSDPRSWVKIEKKFKDTIAPGKDVRLFMLCVRKNMGNKWQKFSIGSNDVVLADVFSCAQLPPGEKIAEHTTLQVREIVDSNTGMITDTRYLTSKNTLINLTPILRRFDNLLKKAQESQFSRTKGVFNKMLNKGNKRWDISRSIIDALKFRKIKKNNSNEREITAIGYVIRLLQGELKNEFGIPIKAVVLQGENNNQLSEIVKRHMLKTGKLETVFERKNDNKTYSDYQLIRLLRNDYESSDNMREFFRKIMFSSPANFFDQKSALNANVFRLYQRPFSKEFISGGFFKGAVVYNFFTGIQKSQSILPIIQEFERDYVKKSVDKRLLLQTATQTILQEKQFVNQQQLQELLELDASTLSLITKSPNSKRQVNNNNEENNDFGLKSEMGHRRRKMLATNIHSERLGESQRSLHSSSSSISSSGRNMIESRVFRENTPYFVQQKNSFHAFTQPSWRGTLDNENSSSRYIGRLGQSVARSVSLRSSSLENIDNSGKQNIQRALYDILGMSDELVSNLKRSNSLISVTDLEQYFSENPGESRHNIFSSINFIYTLFNQYNIITKTSTKSEIKLSISNINEILSMLDVIKNNRKLQPGLNSVPVAQKRRVINQIIICTRKLEQILTYLNRTRIPELRSF